jgi:hypothetical protein
MLTGAFAQDGARAYFLLPEDTNIISFTTTLLHKEIGGSEFGVVAVTPSYRRSFDVGGNAGVFLIGIPVGGLSASIDTGMGNLDLDTDLAQGDLFLGGEVGLLGSPSLAVMDYVQYEPGFRMSVATRLFLPTGDYDSSRLLNLGGNRWSLQASLPISYVLGDSMIDSELTTFEIIPTVQIFGDNNDAFGPATVKSQEALLRVEGHVTRTFGPAVWAALDAYYELGGETSSDGVPQGDARETAAVGATLGLVLSPSLALRLTYVEQIHSNVPDSAARGFELVTAVSF